jgi:DNA-directed RNA polymerase alpha subunit
LTELPAGEADPARAEWIRTASRTRFGQVRSKVLADIERSMMSARPDTKVEDMDWSVRTRKALQKLNISTLGELTGHTETELLSCPNLGQTSLDEIKPTLARWGLSLKGSE